MRTGRVATGAVGLIVAVRTLADVESNSAAEWTRADVAVHTVAAADLEVEAPRVR